MRAPETRTGSASHLGARLHRVAAVDEEARPVLAHDAARPADAGEAREPFEALGRGRHVLALVLVGTRDEKGIEAFVGEQRAQAP